ncbi:Heat shock factor protein 4, partial [Coemansia aciculifera]
ILTDNGYVFLRWSEDGLRVIIDDFQSASKEVLPLYFETAKFSSFIRQFHMYGFTRTTDARKNKKCPRYIEYVHKNFRRGHYDDLKLIVRRPLSRKQLREAMMYTYVDNSTMQPSPESSSSSRSPQLGFDDVATSTQSDCHASVGQQSTTLSSSSSSLSSTIAAYLLPQTTSDTATRPLPLAAVSRPHILLPPTFSLQQANAVATNASASQQMLALLQHESPDIRALFETPYAKEVIFALQKIEDNFDHLHLH